MRPSLALPARRRGAPLAVLGLLLGAALAHADGGPTPPPDGTSRVGALYPTPGFRHGAHLPRVGPASAGRDRCRRCHEVSSRSPRMETCEGCHDGRAAFRALGTSCRRCHAGGPTRVAPAAPPTSRFEHAHHVDALRAGCRTCHALGPDGRPLDAAHDPCSSAACHAADFRAASPRTCGACHVGTEPWRPLHAEIRRRPRTEFGVDFSHSAHLSGETPRLSAPCAGCHTGVRGGPERRLGRGHASCAGPGDRCHAVARGARPTFERCDACHALGRLPAREAAKARAPWPLIARFRHAPHREGQVLPGGGTLACTTCHASALAAASLAEIRAPKKTVCARCHDGQTAWKLTGPTCARCHGPAATARSAAR